MPYSLDSLGQEKGKDGPPPLAPAHGYRAKTRHVYFPDHNFYFDVQKNVYIYLNGSTWKVGAKLPSLYAGQEEMKTDLMKFLIFYLLFRRHGSLKKELGVKTPFEAVEKWYELKPEIFLQRPLSFKEKILNLHHQSKTKQDYLTPLPCES